MPIRMSTRSRYGLRLMVSLALNDGRGATLTHVSHEEGISEKYLGQIIIPLKNAGLVISHRGSRGGYSLARAPEEITARDVVEAIEGRITPVPCVDDPASCARAASCAASGVWKKLGEDIARSLSSFTLAALARQARAVGAPTANYSI